MPSVGRALRLAALAAFASASDFDDGSRRRWMPGSHSGSLLSAATTTSSSTATTTSTTTAPHVSGGQASIDAYDGFLTEWRKLYRYGSPCGVTACLVPELPDDQLPESLKQVRPQVVISDGGVAGGVVTEGMGYGIMIEGFEAARGSRDSLDRGLALVRSWLSMVRGPFWSHPLAGGREGRPSSATEVDVAPYGVSAIADYWGHNFGGLPAWKWPLNLCKGHCNGTATDGDQDALLGMIYLAAALGYPSDFVDLVMRTLISFASADLGFPDMYRVLPGGEKVFVPRMGSTWGGLTPPSGPFKTQQEPWCYGPGYFAPAHYRIFRDFARNRWSPDFDGYLPPRNDGTATMLGDLLEAMESAITAGYNILYRASCMSGSVANWVGVEAECEEDPSLLHCEGVPWKHTPYVGPNRGTCSSSNTGFGQFGADASRAPWRIAMDFHLFRDESNSVAMYDRDGFRDRDLAFGSQAYLNRIVGQYKYHSKCDGGSNGNCLRPDSNPPFSPWRLATAFDPASNPLAPDLTCDFVPKTPSTWWASYMAYPTFTAFVAPFSEITPEESSCWMDTFASICNFKEGAPTGSVCGLGYFDLSQEVIATMVMASKIVHLDSAMDVHDLEQGHISMDDVAGGTSAAADARGAVEPGIMAFGIIAAAVVATAVVMRVAHRSWRSAFGGCSYTWLSPSTPALGSDRFPEPA